MSGGLVGTVLVRQILAVQRRMEGRGPHADPWTLIAATYGSHVLAATDG